MTTHVVDVAALGVVGEEIGSGGQARVFHAPEILVPDVPSPLVYKRYREGQAPPHGLGAVVARRLSMDEATRARLDRLTAWPVRIVEEAGVVQGVLMPLIPDVYFQRRVLPSGKSVRSLLEVQHLFVAPERATRLGMPAPSRAERLLVCRDLASAVHLLHRNDFVIGDMNAMNAVFQFERRPCVMLVDCDAIRIKGSAAVVRQLNAPDWDPPEDSLSQESDLYKFGLFVLRCLAPGDGASVVRDPARADAVLDAEGRRLLRAALGTKARERTTAQAWGRYFDGSRATPTVPTTRRVAPAPVTTSTSGWRRDPVTRQWVQVT